MDRVEEFTAAESSRRRIAERIAERRRIALAIFLFSLIIAINFDGVTAEVAEHSEEVFR